MAHIINLIKRCTLFRTALTAFAIKKVMIKADEELQETKQQLVLSLESLPTNRLR